MKPRRIGFLFKRNPKVPERKTFALESYEPDFYTGLRINITGHQVCPLAQRTARDP